MSELKQRLQETSSTCMTAYEAWHVDTKSDASRETLLDAVHELRKVASRLEIEIALSDRKNTNAKRIPIPEHKSKMENRKDQKPLSEILPVAELKKARRKKIEIEAAQNADSEDTGDTAAANEGGMNAKRSPRPRRQKKDAAGGFEAEE